MRRVLYARPAAPLARSRAASRPRPAAPLARSRAASPARPAGSAAGYARDANESSDAIPFSYYRRKLACEREVADSGVPHTILRATQFHELFEYALRAVERLPVAPLPLSFRVQSVAAAEAAARAAELLGGEPLGRAPDFGGPEVLSAREVLELWRERRGRPRRVVNLPLPGRVARGFREGLNTCPEHADGRQSWTEFVRALR